MPLLLLLIRLNGLFDVNEALLCVIRYPSPYPMHAAPIFFIHTIRYIVIKRYPWNLDPPHFSRLNLKMINNKKISIYRFSILKGALEFILTWTEALFSDFQFKSGILMKKVNVWKFNFSPTVIAIIQTNETDLSYHTVINSDVS